MRDDMLTTILSELNGSNVDIEASAVISADGLMMASLLPGGLEEDRIGAMSAAILALGGRTAAELERGDLEQVLIKGNNGFVLLTQAGNDAVLAVMTRATAKLGLIFLDVRRAAEKIAKIL
jgi:predicted regulator of Ras-like GTPase activity (Roadblock/LC7/MglB family)